MVVCQEIVHSLRYTSGRRGGIVLKLDMEKAYDRMSWQFIVESLKDEELPNTMVKAIKASSEVANASCY